MSQPAPRTARVAALLAALLAATLPAATPALAHPLGNFSISHYAGIQIGADGVQVRYVVDLAEIPTFQQTQDTGLVAEAEHPSVAPWVTRTVEALARGLLLTVDGQRLTLTPVANEVIFPPGAGGLPTLKLGVTYRAPLGTGPAGVVTLRYADENFAGRAGWKEIVVTGRPGVTIVTSTAPAIDRSQQLNDYPIDLLDSPPQDLDAQVTFTREPLAAAAPVPDAPAPPAGLRPNPQSARPTLASAFTDLVATRELGTGAVAAALMVAVVLGAFHALEPGHGKTVVAAYLVGSRGTARHALILGLVVTASHTAGVYLLGGVTFFASRHVMPERLYPWISLGSGLTIAVLGAVLFLRRYARVEDTHHHHHGHSHSHGPGEAPGHEHEHPHGHAHGHAHHDEPVSVRALVALGVSGGIIPCPAALVVLLSALSMHRIGFGLVLIVAFSVGLAAVLVIIGILLVYARGLMSRFHEDGPWIRRRLPLASSAVMTLLGLGIAAQAVMPWIPR